MLVARFLSEYDGFIYGALVERDLYDVDMAYISVDGCTIPVRADLVDIALEANVWTNLQEAVKTGFVY